MVISYNSICFFNTFLIKGEIKIVYFSKWKKSIFFYTQGCDIKGVFRLYRRFGCNVGWDFFIVVKIHPVAVFVLADKAKYQVSSVRFSSSSIGGLTDDVYPVAAVDNHFRLFLRGILRNFALVKHLPVEDARRYRRRKKPLRGFGGAVQFYRVDFWCGVVQERLFRGGGTVCKGDGQGVVIYLSFKIRLGSNLDAVLGVAAFGQLTRSNIAFLWTGHRELV